MNAAFVQLAESYGAQGPEEGLYNGYKRFYVGINFSADQTPLSQIQCAPLVQAIALWMAGSD